MAKFSYFIVDLDNGTVTGTNDEDLMDKLNDMASDSIALIDVMGERYTSPAVDDEKILEYKDESEEEEDPDGDGEDND